MVLAEPDAGVEHREDAAERVRAGSSRWRESRVSTRSSNTLLRSSYDVVNEILDHPPINTDRTDDDASPPPVLADSDVATPDDLAAGNGRMQGSAAGQNVADADDEPTAAPSIDTNRPSASSVTHARVDRARNHRKKLLASLLVGSLLALGIYHMAGDGNGPAGRAGAMAESPGTVALKPVASGASRSNDRINEAFQSPLPGIASHSSLAALLQFVSLAADVPIALDVDSLKYSRVDLDTRVNVSDVRAPLGELLQNVLRPLQLAAERQDGVVVVTSVAMGNSDQRQAKHDVSDLLTPELTAEALGALIRDLVQPQSWHVHGGSGTMQIVNDILTINHAPRVHLDVLAFCDALRQARGIPGRRKQASSAVDTISAKAARTLASRVDVRCQQPTKLTHVLAQIEKAAGCHLLVDWKAVQQSHGSFDDRVVIACDATELGEVLDRITQQLALTFRMVGSNSIEITTKEAERNAEIVVFHPQVDGASSISQVMEAIDEFQLPDSPGQRVALEPVSGTLAVRLPWSLQRRISKQLP
jgi:hypothetical protein